MTYEKKPTAKKHTARVISDTDNPWLTIRQDSVWQWCLRVTRAYELSCSEVGYRPTGTDMRKLRKQAAEIVLSNGFGTLHLATSLPDWSPQQCLHETRTVWQRERAIYERPMTKPEWREFQDAMALLRSDAEIDNKAALLKIGSKILARQGEHAESQEWI